MPILAGAAATMVMDGVAANARTDWQVLASMTNAVLPEAAGKDPATPYPELSNTELEGAARKLLQTSTDTASVTTSNGAAATGYPAPFQLVTQSGGAQGSVMQPTLVINYCIALVGIFPARN